MGVACGPGYPLQVPAFLARSGTCTLRAFRSYLTQTSHNPSKQHLNNIITFVDL
jgi:hypothetical protein